MVVVFPVFFFVVVFLYVVFRFLFVVVFFLVVLRFRVVLLVLVALGLVEPTKADT